MVNVLTLSRKLKTEHLWALVVLTGVFVFVNTHPIRPNDFWFHLAYGRILAQSGQIPTLDIFSFTREGQPYLSAYNYWLAQWFLYHLFRVGGAEWSILVASLLVTFTYALILWMGLRQTGNWRLAAAGALFAAAAGITNWNVRPQLLVYPLAALSILGIESFRAGVKRLRWGVVLVVAIVLWVNCHATFFIPVTLVAFWLAEAAFHALRQQKIAHILPPLGLLMIFLLGTLINPRGYRVYFYVFNLLQAPSVQKYIYEWQPASLSIPEGRIFFALLAAFLLIWLVTRLHLTLSQGLSLLFFTALGLRYGRAVIWFGLTQAHLLVAMLQNLGVRLVKQFPLKKQEIPAFNIIFAILLFFLALASVPWLRKYWPLSPEKQDIYAAETPVEAVAFLQEQGLPARIFSDIGFSSYLIWACAPDCQVFADPRFDLYPAEIWADYLKIGAAQGDWDAKLRHYGVQVLLLSPKTQKGLIEAAQDSSVWKQVYQDSVAVAFVRNK